MSADSLSLAALVSHPIQYQAPLFRTIDGIQGIDLTVYFCDERGVEPTVDPGFGEEVVWDRPLLDGYGYEFLPNLRSGSNEGLLGDVNPRIVSKLRAGNHDALWVHGYTAVTNWLAFLTAQFIDLPVIFRGESTLLNPPPAYLRPFKRLAIKTLFHLVDAYGAIGTRNREFYRSHGVPDEQLFHAPYTVHNEYFQSVRQELSPTRELRADIGLEDHPVVLFVGKLVERKRPLTLLEAFSEATDPGEATLLYVGDGNQRATLERASNDYGRTDDVVFVGFQNQSDLPRFYEMGNLLVLPSAQENWGLVINEAMNFELPIITTEAVGAAADLVTEANGRVVPVDDVQTLSERLETILFKSDLHSMGEQSRAIIDEWGIEETAEGIVEAAYHVV